MSTPGSLHVPSPPTTTVATLHPPKKTSAFPFARPLGWAKQNGDGFGSLVGLVGLLAAPLGLWRGRVALAPPQQLGGQDGQSPHGPYAAQISSYFL